jgi:hypothetical protein
MTSSLFGFLYLNQSIPGSSTFQVCNTPMLNSRLADAWFAASMLILIGFMPAESSSVPLRQRRASSRGQRSVPRAHQYRPFAGRVRYHLRTSGSHWAESADRLERPFPPMKQPCEGQRHYSGQICSEHTRSSPHVPSITRVVALRLEPNRPSRSEELPC